MNEEENHLNCFFFKLSSLVWVICGPIDQYLYYFLGSAASEINSSQIDIQSCHCTIVGRAVVAETATKWSAAARIVETYKCQTAVYHTAVGDWSFRWDSQWIQFVDDWSFQWDSW